MDWMEIVLSALVLGLLVKTNLIEDRVKQLGEEAESESERRANDARDEGDAALDDRTQEHPSVQG